jgi:hypothetical protein
MKIKILSSASQDLIDGYYFYEKQSDIDSLVINASIHPAHFEKYQRLLSRRFPFSVYYRVEKKTVNIYAVLDCRRNPAWIRKKLQ